MGTMVPKRSTSPLSHAREVHLETGNTMLPVFVSPLSRAREVHQNPCGIVSTRVFVPAPTRATCTGKALKRRKELYEALHPETKRGATLKQGPKRQNVATEIPSFAADTAAKTGTSRRTVEPRTPSPVRRNAPARLKGRVDRERVDERPGASWNVQPAGGEISKIWEFGPHVDMAGRFG
jgi:hypothetical protein